MSRTVFLSVVLSLFSVGAEHAPVVTITSGIVKGTYQVSTEGQQYAAFEGIPYARPPVGDLRFKEPQPMLPWKGVWEANTLHTCLQLDHTPQSTAIQGEEDCLYLNVYTKQLKPDKLLDVIVHIHGGGFMFGYPHLYGPKILLNENIVYVNLNYRLGPLGFLSTEDDVVPGNNGMKDQSFALLWIKDNIKHFGGNPDSVTLTGLSAGGASTHYHYLSPLSIGLFHRGISVSGTALNSWTLVESPLGKTKRLAAHVGCNYESSLDIVDCLRQRSALQLVQASSIFLHWLYNPTCPFGIVVENGGENRFLPEHPYKLLKDGEVQDLPWLTSVTSEEGLDPAADFIHDDHLAYLDQHWDELAPHFLYYDDTVDPSERSEIGQKIKKYYLNNQTISKKTIPSLVKLIGDRLFVADSEKAVRLQAKINKSPVYYYYFNYRGEFSTSEYYTKSKDNYGVSHADDILYLLSRDAVSSLNNMDEEMSQILRKIWISFATTNTPNVENVDWKPVSSDSGDQLDYIWILSPSDVKATKAKELGHRHFWDSLPFKENEKLYPGHDEL